MTEPTMSGYAKIAFLTRLLGKDAMVRYTNYFNRDTVEKIQAEIPVTAVLKTDADALLEEFNNLVASVIDDSAVSGLIDAWDNHHNDSLIRIPPDLTGLQKLAKFSVDDLFNFIEEEEILNQVVILKNLPIDLAKGVFQKLDIDNKAEFTVCAATAKDIPNEQLKYIDHAIEARIDNGTVKPEKAIDKVLPFTDVVDEVELNELLSRLPEDLAEEIRVNTITISIIAAQSEKVIGLVFERLSADTIAQALCTQPEEFKNKVLATCTNNRVKEIEYSLKSVAKPNDTVAVKNAQREVITIAKSLQSTEEIVILR